MNSTQKWILMVITFLSAYCISNCWQLLYRFRNHFPGDGTVSKTDFYNFWNQVGVIVLQIKTESLISSKMINIQMYERNFPPIHAKTLFHRFYMILLIFTDMDTILDKRFCLFLFTSKFLNCTDAFFSFPPNCM